MIMILHLTRYVLFSVASTKLCIFDRYFRYKSTVSRFKQTQTSILEDNIGTFFFFFEVWRFLEKLKVTYLFWKASLRHVLQFSDYN